MHIQATVEHGYVVDPVLNQYVMNRLSHPFHLDESMFIFRVFRSNYSFLFHFSMKIM